MRTQCNSKLLEFEGHGRRRLVAKKLIFLFSWSFVPLRGYLFSLSVFLRGPSWIESRRFLEIFSPFPTLGGSLLSLLQPLSGPSPFFVALRGYLFAFS